MDHLYSFCWLILAQAQNLPAVKDAGEVVEKAGKDEPVGLFGMGYLFPAMMGVVLLYMVMSAKPPAGKGPASKTELLANLKKNDQVLTAGGILGTVVNYRSDAEYVTLRVDDSSGSRMQILASSIVRVVSDEDSDKKTD
ncbi:preprotein translocase subunit YajC [Mariniblastus sp.]|nr:preprotein translocase subunit YajC [Mariniblastus sp.]